MNRHFYKHALFTLLIIAVFSAIVMLLWNALIPGIFGITSINYWQALGLLVLARILFGHIHGHSWKEKIHSNHSMNTLHDKWINMSPEERQEFIKRRHHYHFHGFNDDLSSSNKTDKESKSGE